MGDQEQEEPSTPILKTLAVEEQRKPEGMVGGGERSMIELDEDAEKGIPCGTTDKEEADTEIGFMTSEGRNMTLAILSLEGQGTSMHSKEP